MKLYRLVIVFLCLTALLVGVNFSDDTEEIDTGLPMLQKIIGTDEHMLADDSGKYCFDGKKEFLTPNILESLANICFTVYKFFIQIEIILVALSYKLELFTLMKDQIAILMRPITVVFYDTWKIPVLLILLLYIMVKSLNSKNTYVIGQVAIAGFVIGISIIFLGNPVGTLEVGYDVVSSMNEMILKESSLSNGNTEDYIASLCNQLWIAQVEKPWEILNFNNKTNADKYKSEFLKYNHGSEERDKLTEELRKVVPEQGYNWVATSFFIGIIQFPKIAIIVILAVLNLGTDVMLVLLTISAGIVFLLSLVPGFGIGVLLKWFEKIISTFVVSVLVTSALTILNELSSLLYGQVDRFNVFGVLIIELVIMLFLIIFRGWIFSGIKALRHGERGAKAALENTPSSKHVYDTTSNFMKEEMYSRASTKPKEETIKKSWNNDFSKKNDSTNRSKSSNYYENTDEGNRKSSNNSNSEYYKYYNYKRKQERKDNENQENQGYKKQNSHSNTPPSENYIRFSDYDEKEKIHAKYDHDPITEDMSKEDQARTYLNNQYKEVMKEKELFEANNVTLEGKPREFKLDKTSNKIFEREQKGEPLFTENEVMTASIYIENKSAENNISRSEYANFTNAGLSEIISSEKKYSPSDINSENTHEGDKSNKDNIDEKKEKSSKEQQYYDDFYSKHKDNDNTDEDENTDSKEDHSHHDDHQEESHHDGDHYEESYYEKEKESNSNENEDLKSQIKSAVKDEIKESDKEDLKEVISSTIKEALSKDSSKSKFDVKNKKFDEILKNDIEEKKEVEEIHKKLDKIEKKVDKESGDNTDDHKKSTFQHTTGKSKSVSLGDYDEKN